MVVTATYGDGKTAAVTKDITWTTSDSSLATIFSAGLVKAVAVGNVTISASVVSLSGSTVTGSTGITIKGPYAAVSSGGIFSVARKSDGTLWGWGQNMKGSVGDGTWIDRYTPVQIGTVATWANFSSNEFHTLALRADGTVWAWGYNLNGQLGDKSTVDRWSPVKVGTATTWVSASTGQYHSVAVKKDGSCWAWGRNFDGQLGDGTQGDKNEPTAVTITTTTTVAGAPVTTTTPIDSCLSMYAGATHSLVLKTDGAIWSWGNNSNGQLGQGASPADPLAPTAIPGTNTYVSASAGASHNLAIRSDGALYAWGANSSGQLGNGATIDSNLAIRIGTADNWAIISAGGSHSVAIKSDGTLWTWGSNTYGQLGYGNTTSSSTPKKVGTDTNWVAVSAGKYHTFAVKADGTLWGWGRTREAQLGNGSYGPDADPVLEPTIMP
jgi:alpha-tubulin suppressor-like RCC1 family protein